MYIRLNRRHHKWILVKDLRTGYIVTHKLVPEVTIVSLKETFRNAKNIARKCPERLRCDGLHGYQRAARAIFGDHTEVEVHHRIRNTGQNQSIEGTNSQFRMRLNSMRGLHSNNSETILKGLILDYNFARPSQAIGDIPPAKLALGWNTIDGIFGWKLLFQLVHHLEYPNYRLTDRREQPSDDPLQRRLF